MKKSCRHSFFLHSRVHKFFKGVAVFFLSAFFNNKIFSESFQKKGIKFTLFSASGSAYWKMITRLSEIIYEGAPIFIKRTSAVKSFHWSLPINPHWNVGRGVFMNHHRSKPRSSQCLLFNRRYNRMSVSDTFLTTYCSRDNIINAYLQLIISWLAMPSGWRCHRSLADLWKLNSLWVLTWFIF